MRIQRQYWTAELCMNVCYKRILRESIDLISLLTSNSDPPNIKQKTRGPARSVSCIILASGSFMGLSTAKVYKVKEKQLKINCIVEQNLITTRMHSSRMRTGRSLTICRSLLPGGVYAARGGVCSWGLLLGGVCSQGVSAPGGVS